jgi:hypothetical protein
MRPLERRARQIVVDTLLDELAAERRELYRRTTWGARAAAVRDLKRDYEATRIRLAELNRVFDTAA